MKCIREVCGRGVGKRCGTITGTKTETKGKQDNNNYHALSHQHDHISNFAHVNVIVNYKSFTEIDMITIGDCVIDLAHPDFRQSCNERGYDGQI